jgi:hypothetical protein
MVCCIEDTYDVQSLFNLQLVIVYDFIAKVVMAVPE